MKIHIAENMIGRGERRAFGFLNEGRFRPFVFLEMFKVYLKKKLKN